MISKKLIKTQCNKIIQIKEYKKYQNVLEASKYIARLSYISYIVDIACIISR